MPHRKPSEDARASRPLTQRQYERRVARASKEHYELRLYVAGTSPLSTQAIENLNILCHTYLEGRYHLEVIDIHQQPQAVDSAQIVAAPTLVKTMPPPARRFVGNLAGSANVMRRLNMIANPVKPGAGCVV
ncbi:MAG: circadian clock KaiB family protein [Prosthecobacter sp.]